MKHREITRCAKCGHGVLHNGIPLFFRVAIEHFGVDLNAVRRAAGLEMMLGSAALAQVMGPDEDIATRIGEGSKAVLCHDCALDPNLSIGHLWEILTEREEAAARQSESTADG